MNYLQNSPENIFHTVDFWKSALITMPDNSFFELIRSVFGKIKTPFKKQQLVNDLETFLLREDIQKAIKAYINKDDAKIIAATALFGDPVPDDLKNFFSGELSYARLQDIIVNLEERFILYRYNDEKISRISLNPVLKQILIPFATDITLLFDAQVLREGSADSSRNIKPAQLTFNDRMLAAICSFAAMQEQFFRADITGAADPQYTGGSRRVMRKRTAENAKSCFPGKEMNVILGSLQVLGLFYVNEDRLVPDKKNIIEFGELSEQERKEYYTAALTVYGELHAQKEILSPLYRTKIREYAKLIHCFFDLLDADCIYPKKTLHKLMEILKRKTSIIFDSAILLDTIEKTGFLQECREGMYKTGITDANEVSQPFIAIDSGFSVVVFPGIEYADVICLAEILEIKETGDSIYRFQLNKDSIVRAFNNNISTDEIIELLKRLSGNRIDDNLIWTLKDWEKRHSEVTLSKGIVLSLSPDRRYLSETQPLAGIITETLAPGLYLLPEDAMDDTKDALYSAGIDMIKCRSNAERKTTQFIQAGNYFPPLAPENGPLMQMQAASDASPLHSSGGDELTEGFHAILKKLQMSETDRAELSARIDRHLVLCESQLNETDLRYEKLEARNMDYAGKQNIARQAIAQQSPVEINVLISGEEDSRKIYGIPKSLEKEGDKLILVIAADDETETLQPDEKQVMRIPLGRISLIRRIKKSIFQ